MTGTLKAVLKGQGLVEVAGAGARYTFRIVVDGSGRRHLDGPHGSAEAMARGGLVREACTLAQAEALHAGEVDY